ncbi:MAG: linear amide C-N hydrolase [Flavisolibacter sp.]
MKKHLLLICILGQSLVSFACTSFFLHYNDQMVFGRNYDWLTETGVIHTNQRGLMKTSLEIEKGLTKTWTSLYGSITFNQYGKEFPTGGMNEKGLVVELMWLDETTYPEPDGRPALSVLQWIQYQLDNCASIKDVIASDSVIRIMGKGAPQHYLVADKNGQAATIEFLEGKMKVHTGATLPYSVLTNNTYQSSIKSLNDVRQKEKSAQFNDNSVQRFYTACNMVDQLHKKPGSNLVNYAFEILNQVKQGSFTKWSIVYDLSNMKVYFKTASHNNERTFQFTDFDFKCSSTAMSYDMQELHNGNIHPYFNRFSPAFNAEKIKQAFRESSSQITVEESAQVDMAAQAQKGICSK